MKKYRTIKAWVLVNSSNGLLGKGQGHSKFFYKKEVAKKELRLANKNMGFNLGWKELPIEIKVEASKLVKYKEKQ